MFWDFKLHFFFACKISTRSAREHPRPDWSQFISKMLVLQAWPNGSRNTPKIAFSLFHVHTHAFYEILLCNCTIRIHTFSLVSILDPFISRIASTVSPFPGWRKERIDRRIQMETVDSLLYWEQTGCLDKRNLGQGSTDQNTGFYAGVETEYSPLDSG